MSASILLDAGPLGLLAHTIVTSQGLACTRWLRRMLANGNRVFVPEIADYEVRRELIRIGSVRGLAHLDALKDDLDYLPITTAVMLQAAQFWALARQRGRPTAADAALDGDVVLAAQAASLVETGERPIIATTNVRHLSLFADARLWQDIS